MVPVWEEKVRRSVGGQERVGSPCDDQEIIGPTCHIQLYPWLQPRDGYLWQAGWLERATSVLLNHREGRLGTWPWGCWVPRAEWCPLSQLMAFAASHFRRLVMVWSLFGPMSHLSTDCLPPALSFKDSGFAIGLPWRVASIQAYIVPFLVSLSWALASFSCSLL